MIGGVYIYRARKPGARLRIPLLSWHFAYVGETFSFHHRHLQHTRGGGTYGATPKPWSDLDPYVWLRIPLPPWKWLLRSVETLAILLTWPVYNVQKNRWNPRRIPPLKARVQRMRRNAGTRLWSPRPIHVVLILAAAVALWLKIGGAW
jgi:hypothetical protein